jgi:hypothetical protein
LEGCNANALPAIVLTKEGGVLPLDYRPNMQNFMLAEYRNFRGDFILSPMFLSAVKLEDWFSLSKNH